MPTKTLFILHLPPPVHGAAMVGKYIKDSTLINEAIAAKYVNLSTSHSIDEIGKGGLVKWWRYFKIIQKTLGQVLVFRPEIIYLTLTSKGIGLYKDAVIALLAKLGGAQVVYHFHNKGVSTRQDRKLDNFIYRLVFRKAKVILLSPYLYNDIQKYVSEENVFYCANGIPEVPAVDWSKTSDEIPRLLFLSNLMESKGILVLLDALADLQSKAIPFFCTIIGGEGDITKERLEQELIDRHLNDTVEYVEKQFGKQKQMYFQEAAVFVHPTLDDCFPLVLLEAMHYRLPIVSTNIGAIPEIISDGETGFVLEPNSFEALSSKLAALLEDPEKINEMGEAGFRKFKKNYQLSHFEENFRNILLKISEQ